MQEIVAYCGIVCSDCPAYQATQDNDNAAKANVAKEWNKQFKWTLKPEDINCDGCLAVAKVLGYCRVCEIRKCGSEKRVVNCAYCVDYPCDKLSNFHAKAVRAKVKLEAIRNKNTG